MKSVGPLLKMTMALVALCGTLVLLAVIGVLSLERTLADCLVLGRATRWGSCSSSAGGAGPRCSSPPKPPAATIGLRQWEMRSKGARKSLP